MNTEVVQIIRHFIWLVAAIATLAIAEESSPGRALYLTAGGYGCAVCHGAVANGGGQAGGPIRGATREALDKALAEQPTMQLLVSALSQDNIADLSAYLESLAQIPLIELVYKNQQWNITQKPVVKGQTVQILVFNDGFENLTLDLQDFGFTPTTISPLDTQVLEWTAEPGIYSLPDNNLLVVSSDDVCIH